MIEHATNWVCFFWLLPMLGGAAMSGLGGALGSTALGSAGTALSGLGTAMGGPAAGEGVTGMLGGMMKGLGGQQMQAPQINMADAQPKGAMGPSLEQLVQMRQNKKLGL